MLPRSLNMDVKSPPHTATPGIAAQPPPAQPAPAAPAAGRAAGEAAAHPDLAQQGRWFGAIAEAAPELVYALDRQGRVTYANPALLSLWRRKAADVEGRNLQELGYPPQEVERYARQVSQVVETGTALSDRATMPATLGGRPRIYDYTLSPVFDDQGRVEAIAGIAREATDSVRLAHRLRESEGLYRSLFDSMDEGFCIIEMIFDEEKRPVDYRFLEVNPAFARQTGLADAQGRTIREFAPGHEQHWFDIYGNIALTGTSLRFEQRARELADRWYEVHAFRIGEPELCRVAVLFNDITERKRAEERQGLMMREIDHRARNMLAMIQALVNLTATDQSSVSQFVEAVQSRIHAMSLAQDLVSRSRGKGASLRDLVGDTLAAYTAGRPRALRLTGPEVTLKPEPAMALSLVLHELTTNAAKYGALSRPEGRVAVSWEIDATGLALDWRERGGPAVTPPTRRGFGSTLITASLAGGVGGSADLRFERSGVTCAVRVPAAHLVAPDVAPMPAPAPKPRPAGTVAATSGRVLVVEDQPLIALEAKTGIEDSGFEVVGPAHTLEHAMFIARTEPLDAAVLDIDLGGGRTSYAVADILRSRHIPFVFVSGFRAENLDEAYRGYPVLSKPLRPGDIARALKKLASV